MVTIEQLQHKETLMVETLISSLDARESAGGTESTMLVYLADMLVKRTRDELDEIRRCIALHRNEARA